MGFYLGTFEIAVDAASHYQAAKLVDTWLKEGGTDWVYYVTDHKFGDTHCIDFKEDV